MENISSTFWEYLIYRGDGPTLGPEISLEKDHDKKRFSPYFWSMNTSKIAYLIVIKIIKRLLCINMFPFNTFD
jgi:hypothetical protein